MCTKQDNYKVQGGIVIVGNAGKKYKKLEEAERCRGSKRTSMFAKFALSIQFRVSK